MKISLSDIAHWGDKYRIRFINSLSGYKGVHLIGTQSAEGSTNLAVFNSVVHIGALPPLIGFIMRPLTVERHTYKNIIETKCYTINHVHKSILKQAHYTAAKFPADQSEFDACNLTIERIDGFVAPFVKESKVKFGLTLSDDIPIERNGTRLLIGKIEHVLVDDEIVQANGQLDLELAHDVCVTGLNQYSSVSKFVNMPEAKIESLPSFRTKERADNVVFDKETQQYHASMLPYGTNIGAPRIETSGVSAWRNSSISSFNHVFQNKIADLKVSYQKLIEEYEANEMVYNAKIAFEPIVGQTYFLYLGGNVDKKFLSLIPPTSWRKEFIGAFKLNHEKVWEKVEL